MIVYAVVDDALSPDFPLGDAIETFIRREDAERFVEEVPSRAYRMRFQGDAAPAAIRSGSEHIARF